MDLKIDEKFVKVLDENGFIDLFWIEKFKENGIKNINQLKYVDRKVLN